MLLLLLFVVWLVYVDMLTLDTYFALSLSLRAAFGQTFTRSDRQDSVVATSAISTANRNAERFCLHGSAAHAVLLHSVPLQGVHGLTATFALTDTQRQRRDFTEVCRLIQRVCGKSYLAVVHLHLFFRLTVIHFDVVEHSRRCPTLWLRTFTHAYVLKIRLFRLIFVNYSS